MNRVDDPALDGDVALARLLADCDDAGSCELPGEALEPAVTERLRDGLNVLARLRRHWAVSGRKLGRFELVRELGRGGHGVVWLAYDPALRREVALKVPRADVLASAELRRRFLREARATALLSHPGIVPVFERGEAGPVSYIAAAYCPGPSLAERTARAFEPHQGARLVAELADAVQHAHERGVLHRDLKPSNVLLETGDDGLPHPRITDFGLARLLEADETRTRTGAVLGTPRYMAPEQAQGRNDLVGPATDVYALGAILHELVTGAPPEEEGGGTLPALSRDLASIVEKCLRDDPEGRYATAAALAEDLRRFLDGRSVLARRPTSLERGAKWMRRHPGTVAASFGVLLLAVAGLVVGNILIARQRDEAIRLRRMDEERFVEMLRLVMETDDQIHTGTGPLGKPTLAPWQRSFMERLMAYFDAYARSNLSEGGSRANLGLAYLSIGHLYDYLADAKNCTKYYSMALPIWEELAQATPEAIEPRRRLFTALINTGNWTPASEVAVCERLAARADSLGRTLMRELADSPEELRFVFSAMVNVGLIWEKIGRLDRALELYRELVPYHGRLIVNAEQSGGWANLEWGLYECCLRFAEGLMLRGLEPEMDAAYAEALPAFERNAPGSVRLWGLQAQWAYGLATREAAVTPEQARQAVTLADSAVAIRPEIGDSWMIQGAARLRNGDWDGAISPVEEALRRRPRHRGHDPFILAIAYAHKGEWAEARKWEAHGIAWCEHSKEHELAVDRMRCEAAALLREASRGPAESIRPCGPHPPG